MKNGPGLRARIPMSVAFMAAVLFSVMGFAERVREKGQACVAQCLAFFKSCVYYSLMLVAALFWLLGIPVDMWFCATPVISFFVKFSAKFWWRLLTRHVDVSELGSTLACYDCSPAFFHYLKR
jgi:NADH:ubiquinone oxidoreductase subunit 2 (subunit N)